MIEGIPKISVCIICYKQEDLIKRAIDSLLTQKDYIHEICVSDDCSPDNTWNVLLEYDKQYPGLFKLHQNNPNVGIFENIENTWSMPTGDIVYLLAGDDKVGEGWFKTVVEYILNNNIDYKNEMFCIYGDYKCIYPNGDSLVLKNDLIKKHNPLSLALRGLICNRSACYSISVLRKFKKVSQGRSHIAEDAQDRQLQLYSQKNYYIEKVGNIYYGRIGVSASIDEATSKEREKIRLYSLNFLESEGVHFNTKEKDYLLNNKKISSNYFINHLFNFFKAYEREYGIRSLKLKHTIFAILRRIPHKKPIEFK